MAPGAEGDVKEPAAKKARTLSDEEPKLHAAVGNGRAFDYSFTGDRSFFDKLWRQSWTEFGEEARCERLRSASARSESTADSENRKRDKAETEQRLGVQEQGNADTALYNERGEVLATGYVQILYGDHGDYFELLGSHVNWELFTRHKLKGPGRHYHEHLTEDGAVQLYDQFNTVADEPNPPPGAKSKHNNRPEGYAAYRPGVLYMPTDAVKRVEHVTEPDLRAAMERGRVFDYSFSGDKCFFDKLWRMSWTKLGEQARCNRLPSASARSGSTADSENRKRDKAETEKRLGLQEEGNAQTALYNEHGQVLARGYVQILYGDHGDYFELLGKHVNWGLFTRHKLKGPGRHYHEHLTEDGSVQLYDQFNTVADEPNPPPGAKSKHNNRSEGYAAYRPGVLYMPTDVVKRIEHPSEPKLHAALESGRSFDYTFTGDKTLFDTLWRQSWTEFGEEARCERLGSASARPCSTADSDNRKRDKAETEERLKLQEAGNAQTVLYNEHDQVLARGYVQILYGDHGDYFELLGKYVNWELFTRHKLKGPGRHYHEHLTEDGSVQLYDQFNTVADEPNPPPGAKSKHNNRPEGYADYRPGVLYMPTEAVKRIDHTAAL